MHETLVSWRATYRILFPLFLLSPTFLHPCNALLRYSDFHFRTTIREIRTDFCNNLNVNHS